MVLRSLTRVATAAALLASTAASVVADTCEAFRGVFVEVTEVCRSQSDWNAIASNLASKGFTDVFGNFTYAGGAYYTSNILPTWDIPNCSSTDDAAQLGRFITAMHNAGLKAHNWVLAYNASYGMGSGVLSALDANGDVARLWNSSTSSLVTTLNGTTWLNYNSYDVRDRLVAIAEEIATNYPTIDGILFDYVRSPGDVSTFDERSRTEFCADTSHCYASSAAFINATMQGYLLGQADGAEVDDYLEWQNGNITYTMQLIKEAVNDIDTTIKISAAVFPSRELPTRHHQDWEWWDEAGYVDFLVPMDYTTSPATFATMIEEDYQYAYSSSPSTLYPAINFANTSMTVANGLDMIDETRDHTDIEGWMFYRSDFLTRSGIPSDFTCP